jgi:hypothetical protein
MTLENNFLLKLNLQQHADDEGDDDTTPDLSGDDELAAAIRTLMDSDSQTDDDEDDNTDDSDVDDDDSDTDDDTDDDEDESDEDEDEDEDDQDDEEDDEPPVNKKQSKEKNAEFAKKRREAEAQARAEAELERLKQESPEFKLAEMLSEQFGKPVEDIMEEIKEQQILAEAKQRKIPVEELREKRAEKERADRLEQEIAMLKFNQWEVTTKADGARLMNEYKMLTQEDIETATNYILNVAKNVELPLEDAVFAVHGKKIAKALAKGEVQEDLAKQSGRKKKTPLSPNNGKASKVTTLTADEQAIARAFGMTNDDYIKYK